MAEHANMRQNCFQLPSDPGTYTAQILLATGKAVTARVMIGYSFPCICSEEELQNTLYCAADSSSPMELKPAVRALSLQVQKITYQQRTFGRLPASNNREKKLLEAFMQRWTPLLITLMLMLGIASFAQQPASAPDQQPSTQQPNQPAQPPAAQPQSPQQPPDQTAPTTDSSASAQQPSGQTFSGTIVKSGDKYVLQDDKGTSYDIDHQDVVKKFEGKKVRVVGTLDSTGKMIHVQ